MSLAAATELLPAVAQALLARGEWLATAESCTGGLIAKLCTDLPGSSRWFERGLVTYSNRAKTELLAVPEALLAQQGAVCEAVVVAMAKGLLARAPVQHAIAVSGIAGPDGGSAERPVGTVWIAWASAEGVAARHFHFEGDRDAVRLASACAALRRLAARLGCVE